jgi:hypothetical protein
MFVIWNLLLSGWDRCGPVMEGAVNGLPLVNGLPAHSYLLHGGLCCISSIVKQSRVMWVYDNSLSVVVCFVRFVDMWLYPDYQILTNPSLPYHQFKEKCKNICEQIGPGCEAVALLQGLAVIGNGHCPCESMPTLP